VGGEYMDGEGIAEVKTEIMRVINSNPVLQVAMKEGKKIFNNLNKQSGGAVNQPEISPLKVKQAMKQITNIINKVNDKVQAQPIQSGNGRGQQGSFLPLLAMLVPALSSIASVLGPALASAGVGILVDKVISGKGGNISASKSRKTAIPMDIESMEQQLARL
jgi:hypothetical protein